MSSSVDVARMEETEVGRLLASNFDKEGFFEISNFLHRISIGHVFYSAFHFSIGSSAQQYVVGEQHKWWLAFAALKTFFKRQGCLPVRAVSLAFPPFTPVLVEQRRHCGCAM